MAIRSPQYDKRNNLSGAADSWDDDVGGSLLTSDYFDTTYTFSGTPAFYNDGTNFTNLNEGGSPFSPAPSTTTIDTGEIKVTLPSNAGGQEVGIRANVGTGKNYRYLTFKYRVSSDAVIQTGHTLLHSWSEGYASDYFQIRVDVDGAGFKMALYDPTNGSLGTWSTTLSKATTYTVKITNTNTGGVLNVGGVDYPLTSSNFNGKSIGIFSIGNFYSGSFAGTEYLDDIGADVTEPASGTTSVVPEPIPGNDYNKLLSVFRGWKTRYQRADGAIVRPSTEGNGDTTNGYAPAQDVVSEGQAYAMIYETQMGTKEGFDLAETFAYTKLDRRNYVNGAVGSNPPTNGYNLMMYHFNPANNTAFDWAAAYDADIDRAKALLWAHARWGSSGTINYLNRALAILQDLVDYGLRQCTANSLWYMVSGSGNMTINEPEMNNSYLDPAAFKLFAQYDSTNRAKWLSAVTSSYDIIQKTADAVLPNPVAPGNNQTTTAKLPANWVTFNFTTGVVTPLSASYRDTNYTYDAFRQTNRLAYDWEWYGDSRALTALRYPKPFFTSYWNTNNRIEAEYFHDGSVKSAYESRFFYYAAWQVLTADDYSNATAQAIWTNKLGDMYKYVNNSSFYDNSVNNSNDVGYYSQSWLLFDEMDRQGVYQNYGQAAIAGTTGQKKIFIGGQWVAKPVKYYNGSTWTVKPVKYHNGTAFVVTNY